jgi:CAAX amino terminal protease family.
MQQLSKTRAVLFHLYPGVIITVCFALLTPLFLKYQLPPQFSILLIIAIVAVPLLLLHINRAKKEEQKDKLTQINGYNNKLTTSRLILCIAGLVMFMFFIWGITQPLNKIITEKLFTWLPAWYTVQDFTGYSKKIIVVTLIFNLVINGILAPIVEEYYFRGYLLPRMAAWGKWSFVVNAILFSLYHFWQPHVYLTLLIALLPLSWLVWKTRDLRVGIYTHCALNIIGALASFGLLMK